MKYMHIFVTIASGRQRSISDDRTKLVWQFTRCFALKIMEDDMSRYIVFYKEEDSGHDFIFVEAKNLTEAVEEALDSIPQLSIVVDIGLVNAL
jgi:hypothetical protein